MQANQLATFRPLRLPELLDSAFRLYRRNFLTFIGIMAMIEIPINMLTLITSLSMTQGLRTFTAARQFNSMYFLGLGGTLVVGLLQFFLVSGVASAALTEAAATSISGGQTGVLDAYRKSGPSTGRVLLTMLLALLASLLLGVWLIIPCVGQVTGVGLVMYFSLVILQLIIPVLILERRSPTSTLRRTWDLARQRFWWLLGLAAILWVLNLVLLGPGLLASSVLNYALRGLVNGPASGAVLALGPLVQVIISALSGILYHPLAMCVMVLAYFDLRVRSEGFDLAMQNLDSNDTAAVREAISSVPIAETHTSWFTGMEFGYFVALTLGGFMLLVIMYGAILALGIGLVTMFSGR